MEVEGWRCLRNAPAHPDGFDPHARVRLPRFAISWCDFSVCMHTATGVPTHESRGMIAVVCGVKQLTGRLEALCARTLFQYSLRP